jgi:hypothetical protein
MLNQEDLYSRSGNFALAFAVFLAFSAAGQTHPSEQKLERERTIRSGRNVLMRIAAECVSRRG